MRYPIGRRLLAMVSVLALLLTGCKPDAPAPTLVASNRAMAMTAEPGNADRRIAFSHSFAVELPGEAVAATQQNNLTDCLAAGCTVLNTHIDRLRNGVTQGSISIRIAPDRYPAFVAAITAPPARLISHTETADDKTVPLLDIEKRLNAQIVLRDRLSQLLQQAGTSVADLVAVEKQLADAQGTIESATAQRDYLRTMTDTVKVDVTYNGLIQQAGPFDVSPIRLALDNFLPGLIQSLGDLITFAATALPWLPLAVLGCWILWRMLPRRFP
jgi:hypothetical protein